MPTLCRFYEKNNEFDYIDDELIEETIYCNNINYEVDRNCKNCFVYKQIIGSKNKEINDES